MRPPAATLRRGRPRANEDSSGDHFLAPWAIGAGDRLRRVPEKTNGADRSAPFRLPSTGCAADYLAQHARRLLTLPLPHLLLTARSDWPKVRCKKCPSRV